MAIFGLLLQNTQVVFSLAVLLRLGLLIQGHYQDRYSALKYTDIDYFVFTDASRYVYQHRSPYLRDTYRYTPLLAWLLAPTAVSDFWFPFGKVLFAIGDIVAGCFIVSILRKTYKRPNGEALQFASLWLLNPMVATISTRGSSEGLLAVVILALLWLSLDGHTVLAGLVLGFAVHFKILTFMYAASLFCWLGGRSRSSQLHPQNETTIGFSITDIRGFFNVSQIQLTTASLASFLSLNVLMYTMSVHQMILHSLVVLMLSKLRLPLPRANILLPPHQNRPPS